MGIAINVVREMRRKTRPMQLTRTSDHEISEDTTHDAPAATLRVARPSPEDDAVRRESHSLLRATLADLPDRQREALLLRYFQELSVEETASAMNCAIGTVKATVHQALRALRNKLKQLT
jgi:RNA polymerase sigma factor (sigma-70 family)